MADNISVTAGAGTTIAADDIAGVLHQRIKLGLGADGAAVDAVAGAGAVSTAVQRVTLASDDPAVVALQILDNAIAGSEMQVDVLTMPSVAVTNAGTFAAQVTTINAVAPAFGSGAAGATVLRTLSATDDPVVTAITNGAATALPAGTNNIGDVDIASIAAGDNNIGNVDVLSVIPGVGATNLGKAEDAAHTTGDTGVAMLSVRRDTAASGAGTDGDYATLNTDANGRLYVTSPALANIGAGEYETVAASQTAQALGATGATGDYISGILVIPATTSPGVVTLLDNATSIPVFVGGATSVSNLVPFLIPLGLISVSGAWKITTGANVSCIGMGNFT